MLKLSKIHNKMLEAIELISVLWKVWVYAGKNALLLEMIA